MNILILNGSPRPNGNTAAMADFFAEEAKKQGHTVSLVQIGNKDIRGCKNCDACRKTLNGNCVQQDDMQELYPLMRECEMLVIASPIYYYSMTGQTHCAVERIYAFERLPKIKKAALLLSAGGGGFTSAVQTYKDAIIGHMGARDMGIVKSTGNGADGSFLRKLTNITGKTDMKTALNGLLCAARMENIQNSDFWHTGRS